jgi:hypothetical protein
MLNTDKYTNTSIDPLSIDNYPWLYEDKDDIESVNTGKWMLFYKKEKLYEKWRKAIKLYRHNQLEGVISMKCSTNYKDPRASDHSVGVIIFYCNNSEKKDEIIKYGTNIKTLFKYEREIAYKTDLQTLKGTRATGCKNNWTYRI